MAKVWLQSLVGTTPVPEQYTRESLTTFLTECISKDGDTKERIKSMLTSVDAAKGLPKTHKLRAVRVLEILWKPE
jgi:hypothetical protein